MNSYEQIKNIGVATFAPLLGFFSPTNNFIMALAIAFVFNIWCGMRADGVVIRHCTRFSGSKFKNALYEFLIYLAVIYMIFSITTLQGDNTAGLLIVKIVNYTFAITYIQNGFKNLIKSYPKSIGLRRVYHFLRLEFAKMAPESLKESINSIKLEENAENI